MSYKTPITDRTLTDITTKTAKAFFNVADWVRIYGNAEIINAIVSELNGAITFDAITEPTVTRIPTVADINILLANIERIRINSGLPAIDGLVSIKHDWLEGSAADAPDYLDVNTWEKVLDIIFKSVLLSTGYRVYCGVANVGQPRLYQHRWRTWTIETSALPFRSPRTGIAVTGASIKQNNSFRRY